MPVRLLHTATSTLQFLHSQYPRVSHGYTCIETTIRKLSIYIPGYGGPDDCFTVFDAATRLPFTLIQAG